MTKRLKILLIEDDAIEIMKLNRAVSSLLSEPEIIEANNGEDALNVLKERNIIPNIILLDLNMPKINGIEFLRILKNDEELKHIPTIILTTSDNKKDVLMKYGDFINLNFKHFNKNEAISPKSEELIRFETTLAETMFAPAELRIPEKTYNKMSLKEVSDLMAPFDFILYLKNKVYT